MPLITVATIVYNDRRHIEDTIKSVVRQTYPNIEYILVDGGSSDGTVDIIRQYETAISRWISEPDSGIYDAMNKAIAMASGCWIVFMNSNDIFYNDTTISDVFSGHDTDADFLYGSVIVRGQRDVHLKVPYRPFDRLWQGNAFCHQALFAKTRLLKANGFNTQNQIVSDFESVFFHYLSGYSFKNINRIVAIVTPGGLSDNVFKRTLERWRIVRGYRRCKEINIYYLYLIFTQVLAPRLPFRIRFYFINKINTLSLVKNALKKSIMPELVTETKTEQ